MVMLVVLNSVAFSVRAADPGSTTRPEFRVTRLDSEVVTGGPARRRAATVLVTVLC